MCEYVWDVLCEGCVIGVYEDVGVLWVGCGGDGEGW